MSNLRNDKFWDELKYEYLHPMSDEEKRAKEAQEAEKRERILDRIWGKESRSMVTGGAAPLEGYISIDRNPYEEIRNDKTLSKEQKIAKIDAISEERNKKIDKEYTKTMAKYIGGAGLEIGSMFIPATAGPRIAGAGFKMAKPLIGQILKKELTKGAAEGTISGGVYGLGRGMLEDKNPLVTAGQDAASGAVLGTTLGHLSGKTIANNPEVKKLDKTLDKRNDWGIAYRKQSGKPAEAIDKLLEEQQGFVPDAFYKEGIGDVDLVWGKQNPQTGEGYGLEHIIDGRTRKNKVDGVDFVKKLPETIENGVVTKDASRPNNIYIEDYDNKIGIPTNWLDKPRNWVLTAHPQNKSASKRLAASAPQLSKPRSGSRSNFTAELTADNNIIPESPRKLKSWRKWLEDLKRGRGH